MVAEAYLLVILVQKEVSYPVSLCISFGHGELCFGRGDVDTEMTSHVPERTVAAQLEHKSVARSHDILAIPHTLAYQLQIMFQLPATWQSTNGTGSRVSKKTWPGDLLSCPLPSVGFEGSVTNERNEEEEKEREKEEEKEKGSRRRRRRTTTTTEEE